MKKLIRAGLFAAAVAALLPVLILTAAGAIREAGASREADAVRDVQPPAAEPVITHEAAFTSDPTTFPAEAAAECLPAATESAVLWDTLQTVRLLTDDGLRTLPLSDYLIGVVMQELPAGFSPDAVAAQAVAARTFALRQQAGGKHDGCVCDSAACCQAWREPDADADPAWAALVADAVAQTDGQVLTYDDALIDATFFSCSGGRTEDAVAVWGGDVPYLVSVDSPGEESAPRYQAIVEIPSADFRRIVQAGCPGVWLSGTPEEWFGEITYTAGGGVASVQLGGQAVTGTALRSLLGLNSTCFTIDAADDVIRLETLGFGHRVGMSQYGADAMARAGADWTQILAHYYPGTVLTDADRSVVKVVQASHAGTAIYG